MRSPASRPSATRARIGIAEANQGGRYAHIVAFHLAQLNVARMLYPADDPRIAGFFAAIDDVNAQADQAPGFVWRLQDESGNATEVDVFGDPMLIVNLSVWESVDALRAFAYRQTDHRAVFRRRMEWFEKMTEAHLVLWWVPAGEIPTPEEARKRLEHLRSHGPGPEGFTFSSVQPAP